MTPMSHHQLPPSRLTAQQAVATHATGVAVQMAGCHLEMSACTAATRGNVKVSEEEEENTMCLRNQLIHSRCTEQG